ncbi:MAG TPA: hypothetical protein VNJ01_05625 [Bacteriovoracaceae bacterium]|nr:hypothetical protein [Bacteriovoracaceae bacterium]
MGKDLGTYHLIVEFMSGEGYIETWDTGARYTSGTANHSPLDAYRIEPPYEDEADLFDTMIYANTSGNFSCDCNRSLFLARAYQEDEKEDMACGDTITLKRLTVIRPDGTRQVAWEETM